MFDAKPSQPDVEIDLSIWLEPTDQDDRYAENIQDP
jgi:hypothetical protein